MNVLLVRHGESSPHVEGRPFSLVDGHGDPELAPEGHEQAMLVADRLLATGERIAAIYVTTLRRTRETAAPLAARLGIEPQVEPDLREVFLGEWEGGELRRRVIDQDPIAIAMFEAGRWDIIPGAEPMSVDGGPESVIDQYAETRVHGVMNWESPVLPHGEHTLRVTVLGDSNPKARYVWINVDKVEIVD